MSSHSIVEAKNTLSSLIDRALSGEQVVITRHGHPVVELRPVVAAQPKRLDPVEIDRLVARRAGRGRPKQDAGTLVSQMRDEDAH